MKSALIFRSLFLFSLILSSFLFSDTATAQEKAAPSAEQLQKAEQEIRRIEAQLAELKQALGETSAAKPGETVVSSQEMDIVRAQSLSNVFREASKKVIPATVKVMTHTRRSDRIVPENLTPEGIPGMPGTPAESMGTGVIIDPKGIVLTNNHVIAGGREVEAELPDGRKFRAVDVKTDSRTDIAVLWLDSKEPLPYAAFGNSDILDIGDWVLAIGNPFELDSTVSAGIISAKGRTLSRVQRGDFLQTDASINPGNSGGPLINLNGEIVGINTAIASASGGNQGIGFAIPSNSAKWIVGQLIDGGTVKRAYLGVQTKPINAEQAARLGVVPGHGVLVERVFEDTPGEKGGIKRDDVILAFDGESINSAEGLQKVVERADVDAKHKLSIIRAKQTGEITLSVARMPEDFDSPKRRTRSGHNDGPLGIMIADLTDDTASRLQISATSGVVIVNVIPGSIADRAGLKQGMVIERIDDLPIETIKDYQAARKRGPLSDGFDFEVVTASGKQKITVKQ